MTNNEGMRLVARGQSNWTEETGFVRINYPIGNISDAQVEAAGRVILPLMDSKWTAADFEEEFNAAIRAALQAASLAAEPQEPDCEYEVTYSSASSPSVDGYRIRRSSGILPSLAVVAEWMGFAENPIAHRRTKAVPAGEWERIDEGGMK